MLWLFGFFERRGGLRSRALDRLAPGVQASGFLLISMPARRYLSYSPVSAHKHSELMVTTTRFDLSDLGDDLLHHVFSFLPLSDLVAASCAHSALSSAAADLLVAELFALRKAWDAKFSALTAFRPGIANVIAASLVDDSIARPRIVLWAGAVHCVVAFLKRVSCSSLCSRNAAAM